MSYGCSSFLSFTYPSSRSSQHCDYRDPHNSIAAIRLAQPLHCRSRRRQFNDRVEFGVRPFGREKDEEMAGSCLFGKKKRNHDGEKFSRDRKKSSKLTLRDNAQMSNRADDKDSRHVDSALPRRDVLGCRTSTSVALRPPCLFQ